MGETKRKPTPEQFAASKRVFSDLHGRYPNLVEADAAAMVNAAVEQAKQDAKLETNLVENPTIKPTVTKSEVTDAQVVFQFITDELADELPVDKKSFQKALQKRETELVAYEAKQKMQAQKRIKRRKVIAGVILAGTAVFGGIKAYEEWHHNEEIVAAQETQKQQRAYEKEQQEMQEDNERWERSNEIQAKEEEKQRLKFEKTHLLTNEPTVPSSLGWRISSPNKNVRYEPITNGKNKFISVDEQESIKLIDTQQAKILKGDDNNYYPEYTGIYLSDYTTTKGVRTVKVEVETEGKNQEWILPTSPSKTVPNPDVILFESASGDNLLYQISRSRDTIILNQVKP